MEQAQRDLKHIVKFWADRSKGLKNQESYSDEKMIFFFLKALEALLYLHSRGVYYGDMKPENLLVFRDYSVKLGA